MVLKQYSQIVHDDGKHCGSAKRNTVNGVAGLDSSGDILDTSGNIALTDNLVDVNNGVVGIDGSGNVNITGMLQGDSLNNYMVQKVGFDILGLMTDPRFLNLMCDDPGAGTMVDISGQGHDGTYQGSMTTSDRLKKGMGWNIDFNGSNDYINLGDDNDFSFGDGTNDEAVTFFGVFELVNSISNQVIIGKRNEHTNLEEWQVWISSAEILGLIMFDNSAGVACYRVSNSLISEGYHSYVITYDGAGGASAADTIKIYVDGVLIPSTATNNGSYVAMENLAVPVYIGAATVPGNVISNYMTGDMCCNGADGGEWSAYEAHRFHQLMKGLYGL